MKSMPRGIVSGNPFAAAGSEKVLGELSQAFEEHNKRQNSRIDKVSAALEQVESAVNKMMEANALGRAFGSGGSALPEDPDYSRNFAAYIGQGKNENYIAQANAAGTIQGVQAAMSVGTDSDGGYLAPSEWDRRIVQKLREATPMRQICRVQSTSRGAFTSVWNSDLFGTGWVGETASRPQTSTSSLSQIVFEAGEIYAQPAATQKILDDSEINLENWMVDSVEEEFSRQEEIAFISGNGSNKPRGLLSYVTGGASEGVHPGGDLATFNSESASDIPDADTLLTFKYQLGAPYRQNARWLMNSLTASYIAKLKDGQGNYIWREGLQAEDPSRLLGHPVTISEAMPNIASGELPIAFGDFQSGYLINDRVGVRVLRDMYTAKPYVLFYVTKRVGGGVLDPHAIKLMKIGVTA